MDFFFLRSIIARFTPSNQTYGLGGGNGGIFFLAIKMLYKMWRSKTARKLKTDLFSNIMASTSESLAY